MTRMLPLCALLATIAACSANGGGGGAKPDLSTDDAKVHYALGFTVGSNMARGKPFTAEQAASIVAGLDDSLTSKTAQVEMPTYGPKVQAMMMARRPAQPGAGPGAGPGAPPPAVDPGKAARGKEEGDGLRRDRRQGTRGPETPLGSGLPEHDPRYRREPDRDRHREGQLRGQAHRRNRLRCLGKARRPGRVSVEPGHSLLDRGRAEAEDRRQGPAGLPVVHRLRRHGTSAHDSRGLHPGLQCGTAGDQAGRGAATSGHSRRRRSATDRHPGQGRAGPADHPDPAAASSAEAA